MTVRTTHAITIAPVVGVLHMSGLTSKTSLINRIKIIALYAVGAGAVDESLMRDRAYFSAGGLNGAASSVSICIFIGGTWSAIGITVTGMLSGGTKAPLAVGAYRSVGWAGLAGTLPGTVLILSARAIPTNTVAAAKLSSATIRANRLSWVVI